MSWYKKAAFWLGRRKKRKRIKRKKRKWMSPYALKSARGNTRYYPGRLF